MFPSAHNYIESLQPAPRFPLILIQVPSDVFFMSKILLLTFHNLNITNEIKFHA